MKQRTEIWLVVLILLFLGIIFSLPLIFNLNSAIPYSYYPASGFDVVNMMHGDHLQFFYTLSQFGDYLREKNTPFFVEPYEFTISGSEKIYSPRELPLSVLFFFLSPLGSAIAYNTFVILSFVACGVSVFLLSGKYLKNFLPRLISSILFAIFPFRLAQLYGGHPNGFIVFFLPLMLYGYESWYETGKWKYALLSGVCIMSMAVEELHLAYYSALFTGSFLVYRGISEFIGKRDKWKEILEKFVYSTLMIAIFWVLAAGYIMHVKQIVFEPSRAHVGREIGEIRLYAPQASDLLRRVNKDSEKFIYPGIISLLLVLLAFRKKKRGQATFSNRDGKFLPQKVACPLFGTRPGGKIKWFYLAMFVITAILSLGPNFRFLPLYNFFYKFIPFFRYPRSTARIIVFAFLSISILSGFGIENILRRRRGSMIAVIAIIFLILDFHPLGRIGLCKLSGGNEVYEYIKGQDEEGVLLEIPLWPGDSSWSSIYEYYATMYHIPMINGYSAFVTRDYIENVFWPLASINMGCLNKGQLELLHRLNVRYIILHEEAYPQKVSPFPFKIALSNMKNSSLVKFVKQDGPLYLFELEKGLERDHAQYSVPSRMGIFYECEYLQSELGRSTLDIDASGERARYTDEVGGNATYLVFGPYQLFPPGRYKVIFRIKGSPSSPDKDFAKIEVAANEGQEMICDRVIKGVEVTGDYSDYELLFAISGLKKLEFRIAVFGNGDIWADYIYLIFQGEKDPVTSFEAEDMFHTGREVQDEYASGRVSIYGNPLIDPPDKLVFGGRRRYAMGSYVASFRLKLNQFRRETIGSVKVLLSGSGTILAEKEISGIDFDEVGRYQDIKLPFFLDKMQVLDFEVDFKRKADLLVDKIEISPRGDSKGVFLFHSIADKK